MVFTYHVRIKEHPAGAAGAVLPDFTAPSGPGRLAYLLIGLIALTAGVAVYALLQVLGAAAGSKKLKVKTQNSGADHFWLLPFAF